jgi:hypothetical protein
LRVEKQPNHPSAYCYISVDHNQEDFMPDQSVQELQARADAAERRAQAFAVQSELTRAIAAQQLPNAAAASQLREILSSSFVAQPSGDAYAVRSRQGHTVDQFVTAVLERDDYKHFRSPVASQPTPSRPGSPVTIPTRPENLGDLFVQRAIEHKQKLEAAATAIDPRVSSGYVVGPDGTQTRTALPAMGLKRSR